MSISGSVSGVLHHKAHTQVWTIHPSKTVFEAISLMAEKNVGSLVVLDGDRLVGIFTERDYTRKVALKGKSSKETAVGEIVSAEVITASPAHTVEECMRLMTEHRIRHLPVIENGRVTGVVSIGDLVNWIISAQQSALAQLEHYIGGGFAG
jgi:CBS domain-containing protein